LVFGFIIGRINQPDGAQQPSSSANETAEPTVWTCSMHPQIQVPDPGKCPICAMDLIPLESDAGDETGERVMTMSESAMALADIATTVVVRELPVVEVNLVGHLDFDETRIKSLTARFPARIDKLYVNFTGIPVQKDEHLALVYSPELSSAQQELIMANKSDPAGSFAHAARDKLRLWDLLPWQIDAILARGAPSDQFELMAPLSGVVIDRNVNEGDYYQTGQTLFKIADLSRLWLFLDAYESDLAWLHFGQPVEFTVEAWPGEVFTGTIAFIEPELDRMTRTVSLRVNVPNPDQRLKPGMFAKGTVHVQVAEGGRVYIPELAGKWISPMHPEIVKDGPGKCDVCDMDLVPAESLGYVSEPTGEAPLLVPSSAVLRTGQRAVVYVRLPDREKPTFEGREIVLGPRAGDQFIVKSGLVEGDRVVTKGAFKIDSSLQIMAKPSMMSADDEPQEMQGEHDHASVAEDPLQIAPATAASILPDYFALQTAMASDNLEDSMAALNSMMAKTGHHGPLPDLIHTMMAAGSLDGIRRPHFETLSNAMIQSVKADPSAFGSPIYLMHCPMVYDDRGADWLQAENKLFNPYWGAVMPRCGEPKGKLN
ncbi:MAG TPA: efflux RND transporter periplasmic adaptor subunit, partial [Oceanipulchritudo sp.]|nr:efflux RND transporter periplasmic adaptor subunit [Oceanipulchritudo sp.]